MLDISPSVWSSLSLSLNAGLFHCVNIVSRSEADIGRPGGPQQSGPLSLVEECRGSALIGRELHSVATPALLCHKEPALESKAPY